MSAAVTTTYEGVAVPPGPYTARGAARPRYAATIGTVGLVLAVAVLIVTLWDRAVANETVYTCPPDCGRPPIETPVANLPRFVAAGGEFTVAYPPPESGYAVQTAANGVTARLTAGDGGLLRLFSEPANGRDARQVVEQLLAMQFPNADVAYELPNAAVGYQPGYGIVANFQPQGLSNRFDNRAIVIAAVKNDLALVATAEGPYRRFSPEVGPAQPSAANVEIALDMGRYVESFSWRGDPPR